MSDEQGHLRLVTPPEPAPRSGGSPHAHAVQFYKDEETLVQTVVEFLAEGLRAGEPLVVIATPAHREAFLAHLRGGGADVDGPLRDGRFVLLDAATTLASFMVDGAPSWDLFQERVGGALRGLGAGRIRAYGEMVDVLWQVGNKQGALALEGMWNDLARRHDFSLLCAYAFGHFLGHAGADEVAAVRAVHGEVRQPVPGDESSRWRVDELLERTRALTAEIAQREELEQVLREALAREKALRRDAEETVRFNEMFAGVLGHDLRNPLGAISMGANYIARSPSPERAMKAATRITTSVERMSRMIDQLLDFTRIRIGRGLLLSYSKVDLGELCCRIKDEQEAANPDRTVEVAVEGDTVGEWDYDRLLQVFSNLAGNALRHGTAGCRIVLSTSGRDRGQVSALVHNEGVVDPEILPLIFEPFRGQRRRQHALGLGLGLYITRQIVVAHGGDIEVHSTPAEGTTMRITLPRKPPAAAVAGGKVEV